MGGIDLIDGEIVVFEESKVVANEVVVIEEVAEISRIHEVHNWSNRFARSSQGIERHCGSEEHNNAADCCVSSRSWATTDGVYGRLPSDGDAVLDRLGVL